METRALDANGNVLGNSHALPPALTTDCRQRLADPCQRYRMDTVSENFSLIVMCLCMLASLAFLAQQILAYH